MTVYWQFDHRGSGSIHDESKDQQRMKAGLADISEHNAVTFTIITA